jgi:hypothetical protein
MFACQDKATHELQEDEEEEICDEQPAISLPGHTAPPINYEGPEFPIRSIPPIIELEPEPSDELAAKIRRADQLQTEVVDWLVCCVKFLTKKRYECLSSNRTSVQQFYSVLLHLLPFNLLGLTLHLYYAQKGRMADDGMLYFFHWYVIN